MYALVLHLILVFGVIGVRNVGQDFSPHSARVIGTVTYREKMGLPKNAAITIAVSGQSDGEQTVIAKTTYNTNGRQVPVPFSLPLENNLKPYNKYLIDAEISIRGKCWFRTEEPVQLLQLSGREIHLELSRAGCRNPTN
jgi:uncharacterized lipoprotein YbaY